MVYIVYANVIIFLYLLLNIYTPASKKMSHWKLMNKEPTNIANVVQADSNNEGSGTGASSFH